jgi:hypothetical protein
MRYAWAGVRELCLGASNVLLSRDSERRRHRAVTGARRSPPLRPVMGVLGETEVERRLSRALGALRPS